MARTRKQRPLPRTSPAGTRTRARRPVATDEARQLSALAQLGELALDTELTDPLLDAACALVQQALGCDAVVIAERRPEALVVRASAGLPPERRRDELTAPAPAGLLLGALGFRAGAEVQLPGRVRPPLLLGAYRRAAGPVAADAAGFLEGVARLLSAALVRQRAEHELCERERLLLAAFEARPSPELLVDAAGLVQEANAAACRLLGQRRRAVVGRTLLAGGAPLEAAQLGAASPSVNLAVAGSAPVAVRVVSAASISSAFTAVRLEPAPAVRRTRVLVVDDEPLLGTALARTLGDDYEVTIVTSGPEALARLDAGERFDVILSDLLMPGMSGLDLYRALADRHPAQARRMALLTGGAFDAEVHAFLQIQSIPWLEKPFEVASLRALLADRLAC